IPKNLDRQEFYLLKHLVYRVDMASLLNFNSGRGNSVRSRKYRIERRFYMRSKNAVPISIFLAIALFIPILQLDNDDPRIFSAGKAQAAQKQLTVTSNAFTANSKIPVQYTGDGKDL